MRRFIGRLGEDVVDQLFDVKRADIAAQSEHKLQQKQAALRQAALLIDELMDEGHAFTIKDLHINGRTLIALGVPPGPQIGNILNTLLGEVQDDKLDNTEPELTRRALELLRS